LASELDAEIYLVRVVVWIEAFSGLRFDPDILRFIQHAKRYLGKLAARYELPTDRTVPIVRHSDNAAKVIIAVADEEGIDLIIMASRCKGWLRRLAQGSVHWGLVRSQVCPVCVCPSPARRPPADIAQWRRREPPMRILVAVDGSAQCEASLRAAARWVGDLSANVYLLQVIDGSARTRGWMRGEPEREEGIEAEAPVVMKEVRTHLGELASRFELPADRTVPLVRCGENAAKVITAIAEDEGIDLIVVGSHCGSWLGQLTQGSVYSEVVHPKVCPVLCVPLPRAQPSGQRRGVLTGLG